MTTIDFVTELFVRVDDQMKSVAKHPQAKLYPSETVTLGVLFALKGVGERAFYRWASRDLMALFPSLPERTRLFRLLATHQDWTLRFLAEPTLIGVIDSYGIELLHPAREQHKTIQPRIATKGKSNYRWIIGAKFACVLNRFGLIVDWDTGPQSLHDTAFAPMAEKFNGEMIVLSDRGFHAKEGDPANLKVCKRGQWNQRMLVETVLAMLTTVCHLKKVAHRVWRYLDARIACLVAAFNLLVQWNGINSDQNGFVKLSIAQFSL